MKKYFIFAAFAGVALASCTDDDLVGNVSPPVDEDVLAPISFSSSNANFTRADLKGAEAAEKLNNMFVVTGFKGSSANSKNTATPGSIVFDNYLVEYTENTAHKTESNSSNWEYVGKGLIPHAVTNGITQQATKYWDYTQTQYDFFAWSTGGKTAVYSGSYSDNEVLVSNIQPNSKTSTWADAGTGSDPDPARIAYTLSGKAADLKECYISDLVTVYKDAKTGSDPTYNVVYKGYQQPVTLKFRQLGTKVRMGIYETVPGYSVKDVKFYTTGDVLTNKATQIVNNATIFSAGSDIYTEGTYKVYFPTLDNPTSADNNQAHIKFAAKSGVEQTTIVDWGGLNYTIRESGESSTDAIYLGRSSNTASFAGNAADNYYKVYLPNETGTNLNLRVDFTLESIDGSKEVIYVKNAKAQVPSIYTTWQPGFAYTYLFKISDKTNGRTGVYDPTQGDGATINSDPAGLYPITFDALVVNAEDQTQETITTIATPSITTYQQNSTVVNDNEYKAATGDIYVTVNEGDALVTLTGKADLYKIEDDMTEAEVIDALTYRNDDQPSGKILGRSGKELTNTTKVSAKGDLAANKWMLTNSVEFGADGNAISVSDDQAMRFRAEAGTYAFVYTETASTSETDFYEARPFANFATGETKYRYAYVATPKTHTDDKGTTETTDDVDYYDAQKGVKYFTESAGAYSRVVAPFIGQDVSNLYLDAAGNTIASGYAVSGVDYYYTVDGGQSYIKAHNVEYKTTGWLSGLYEKSGDSYSATPDTEPANNKAYYYLDGSVYKYCVFLPQQVKGTYVLDEDKTHCVEASETTAVDGQTYFDKYIQNNGVYYAKIIKVQ